MKSTGYSNSQLQTVKEAAGYSVVCNMYYHVKTRARLTSDLYGCSTIPHIHSTASQWMRSLCIVCWHFFVHLHLGIMNSVSCSLMHLEIRHFRQNAKWRFYAANAIAQAACSNCSRSVYHLSHFLLWPNGARYACSVYSTQIGTWGQHFDCYHFWPP